METLLVEKVNSKNDTKWVISTQTIKTLVTWFSSEKLMFHSNNQFSTKIVQQCDKICKSSPNNDWFQWSKIIFFFKDFSVSTVKQDTIFIDLICQSTQKCQLGCIIISEHVDSNVPL